ncbi:ribosomal L7Ae/L30e/S12e/Gadd45 family protein [Clostridium sp. MB40-C1]|uniref:ribosomal L7Ae/L30e/S12e/Gadd45 family protein n=1 Tax=Clostridium sp. MB40-C1 TaxID=3070996 RepID=UPI0027E05B53|nr:ribosomal L7Ae/L30e/S12e/Gadd45 family protein [Clostridium sp. MB40-C1]WMJ80333.1 ribosomal L7Ae/L30e/S12e/Gadd45 family protein [Clostridium sp. MB40-C1]
MVNRVEGHIVIGIKQTLKHLKNGEGQLLYVAKDADGDLLQPVIKLAQKGSLDIIYVDSMKELGKLCGIDVGSAVSLVLKQ